tara:strand:+ start:4184 stop:4429 length:246 start_codon:yes stop_codon:yes gene_type:complete
MDKLLKFLEEVKNFDVSKKQKIYLTVSISWILLIGYLTWWNGMKSISLDKSFRWDEWFWFGIIPAIAPYIFYFIWRDKNNN